MRVEEAFNFAKPEQLDSFLAAIKEGREKIMKTIAERDKDINDKLY